MNEKNASCSLCGLFTALAPANLSRKTGERLYRTWCKACEKSRKDKWRVENKEKHNYKCKQWVLNNPEKRALISKVYSEKTKPQRKLYLKEYRALNREAYRSYCSARRKRVQQAKPPWQSLESIRLVYLEAQIKSKLEGINYHVDHIIPLNGETVCGLHVPWNLQLLQEHENLKKGNSFL